MNSRAKLSVLTIAILLLGVLALLPLPKAGIESAEVARHPENIVKITQTPSGYVTYRGTTAILLAHMFFSGSLTYLENIIPELKAHYDNVVYITSSNATDYILFRVLSTNASLAPFLAPMFDLYFWPNPDQTDPTDTLSALQLLLKSTYLYEKGVILAGNYYKYFIPERYDAVTAGYGITWLDDEVIDSTNVTTDNYYSKSYNYLLHTWAPNVVAQTLSSGGTLIVPAFGSTALQVDNAYNGTNGNTIYIVGTGDNDFNDTTSLYYGSLTGTDIIIFAALYNATSGGKMFLSGSYQTFTRTTVSDASTFYDNLFNWLTESFSQVVISEVTVPEEVGVGAEFNVTITVTNKAPTAADVTLYFEGVGLDVPSSYYLGTVNGSESKTINITATSTGVGYVALKITADYGTGKFTRAVPIKSSKLAIDVTPSEAVTTLYKNDKINVTITVTNPLTSTASNVTVTVTAPAGVTITPYPIVLGDIPAGGQATVTVTLKFSEKGKYELAFRATSDNAGSSDIVTGVYYVYERPLLVFDNIHPGYYNAYRMSSVLKDFFAEYFDYHIANHTLDETVIGSASLILITNPGYAFGSEELSALTNFIDGGGKVILLLDGYGNGSSIDTAILDSILSNYGMEAIQASLWDNSTGELKPYVDKTQFVYHTENPIAEALNYKITITYPTSKIAVFNITATHIERTGVAVDVYPLIEGSELTVPVNATDDIVPELPRYVAAVAVTNTSGALYVFGSTYLLAYDNWNSSSNKAFLRNILAFFFADYELTTYTSAAEVGSEAVITVSVKNKGFVDIRRFNLTIKTVPEAVEPTVPTAEAVFLAPGETENLTLKVLVNELGSFTVEIGYIAGGVLPGTISVTVTGADTEAPVVQILSPKMNETLSTGNVTLTFGATDNYKLARVLVYVDGELVLNQTVDSDTYSYNGTIQLEDGQHNITVVAVDAAGNVGKASVVFTVSIPAPQPPPEEKPGISTTVIIVIVIVVVAAAGAAAYYFFIHKKGAATASELEGLEAEIEELKLEE